MKSLDIILLAAGSSVRFGGDKRVKTLPTVLDQIETAFIDLKDWRILLIMSSNDRSFFESMSIHHSAIQPLYFEHARQGMGASLAYAATFLRADIAMICLADMPLITADTYRLIYQASGLELITVPFCKGVQGHPVSFGSMYFDELRQLSGDVGAKKILARHSNYINKVMCADEGVLLDIDTQEDWQNSRLS